MEKIKPRLLFRNVSNMAFVPFLQALNAALFYNNPDARSYVSLVPTSAHTGDGMGDLISQVVQLTQTRLAQKLSYSEEMESMVLEVITTIFTDKLQKIKLNTKNLNTLTPK